MLRVFVSYSQESADHAAQVLKLAQRLRSDGIDCRLDAFINGNPDEGWQLWMEREIESSDYVLLICTETYLRRFMLEETPATGLGVPWEGQIIRSLLYASQGKPDKVVPIIFRKDDRAFIPRILRYQATYYILMDQYEKLLRFLSGQGGVLPVPVGHPVPLPPEETSPMMATPMTTAAFPHQSRDTWQHWRGA